MARYWRQSIEGLSNPSNPPSDPLTGLQPMRRDRWESVMRAQDHVCTIGRRVILDCGVGSASGWRFSSGEPSASRSAELLMGVANARLTPGSMLRAGVVFIPSGGVGGTSSPVEAFGIIRLRITWTAEDATTETHDVDIDLVPSTSADFDELTGDGEAFGELRVHSQTITPPVDLTDVEEANRWTLSPSVDIEAYLVGGARVVDLCLFEVPYQVAFESDDTEWTSHVFGVGQIDAETNAASPRPRTRRSETDPDGNPRGGTLQTIAVAREQRRRMGPMLVTWGNYQEAVADYNDGLATNPLVVTGSSSGIVCLFDDSMTAYDADREGFAVGCGGYARPWRDTNEHFLGDTDAEAAVPVRFAVLGATTSGTTRIRFQTSDDSWVSVTLTTTAAWREGWGWLKVGVNPSDFVVGQVFVDGSSEVSVYGFTLQVWPG